MGDKWILLEQGVDTIQAGDEFWGVSANKWMGFSETVIGSRFNITSVPCRRRVVDPVCTREAYGSGGAPSPRECGICGVGPCSKADTVSSIVESPDDWVTQDRVPARPGIDERNYQYNCELSPPEFRWQDSICMDWKEMPMHGHKFGDTIVHLRCRRKDLPPMSAKTRTVTMLDVVYWDRQGDVYFVTIGESKYEEWRKLWHKTHVVGTRTVEVPCE